MKGLSETRAACSGSEEHTYVRQLKAEGQTTGPRPDLWAGQKLLSHGYSTTSERKEQW